MKLKIFDTLKRAKVQFKPIDPNHVRIYVCGPTVYDYPHIGNARPVVVFDLLVRLLKSQFPKVTYVRNITDIDDKINARSLESGEGIRSLTNRTIQIFNEDMSALYALPPDKEPRATDHVEEMQAMIKTLIEKGHAYEAHGHILFNVPSMKTYGRLSRLKTREILMGARIDVAPYKKNPQDYILWKPSTKNVPGWESPWGRGRPGWHIECSAMSQKYLGNSFDIHGGGQDLIFPHHENELAQSKCTFGVNSFAKYWMHNGYLMSEGEKMSKSLGNFYTVRELLDEFPGEAIRFLLLKTQYRQPLDFTKDGLVETKAELDRFYQALRNCRECGKKPVDANHDLISALFDDLNSPLAISVLHEVTKKLNKATSIEEKIIAKSDLLINGSILGILQQDPEEWFKWQPNKTTTSGMDSKAIDILVAKRQKARKVGNFEESDKIRDQLTNVGVVLEDGEGGTVWRRL